MTERKEEKEEKREQLAHTMCTTIATSSRSKIRWRQSTDGEHDDRRRKRANQTTSVEKKSEEENFNFVSLITSTDVVFNYFVLTAQAAVRGAGKTSRELEIEPRKRAATRYRRKRWDVIALAETFFVTILTQPAHLMSFIWAFLLLFRALLVLDSREPESRKNWADILPPWQCDCRR